MDTTQIINALLFTVHLSVPVLLAVICGALVAAVLRVTAQIDDQVISFTGKLAGLFLVGYFALGRFFSELFAFTASAWGNLSLYQ
ncbi:MAG TPA: flagellar biosynthetic protein FliQ [Oligoflexia bacterium]|nr:flagellar biosynthetic protein FliQ [Oligoflexia bacterium]